MEKRRLLAVFTVTSSADSGVGTLRAAIDAANTVAGADTIEFDITSAEGAGPHTIALASSLPAITETVTISGESETGSVQNSLTIGSNASLQVILDGSSTAAGTSGLTVDGAAAAGTQISGLVINSFPRHGLNIQNTSGVTVVGNYVGVTAAGSITSGNLQSGILVRNVTGSTIGGTTPQARNVVSGNSWRGIDLDGSANNIVSGNYLGTDASGTIDLGNGWDGINVRGGSTGNVIGGSSPDEGNLISGNNQSGARIEGVGSDNNRISANLIGTDPTGTIALGNQWDAVTINAGASFNTVGTNADGTDDASERNLLSGQNEFSGVAIFDLGTDDNTVAGNLIGTDITGTVAVPNAARGVHVFSGPKSTRIGGITPVERNVISGNAIHGIDLFSNDTEGTWVLGNYIGTDITGTVSLPNANNGIVAFSVGQTLIGTDGDGFDDVAEANVISGNGNHGVRISVARPEVDGLAVADAMIAGTAPATVVSDTIPQADINEGVGGNWTFDNPIPGRGGDDFAFRATGTFEVTTAGDYTFSLGGDDGGRLRIDGVDVIVDDSLHGFLEFYGTANLTAGTHTFEWVGLERVFGAGWELAVKAGAGAAGPATAANGWAVLGDPSAAITLDGEIDVSAYYTIARDEQPTIVAGNMIGLDATGSIAIGNANDGIITEAASTRIIDNVIAGNGGDGIQVGGTGYSIDDSAVAWFSGNGTADDVLGNNNGTAINGAGFAPGVAGQGIAISAASGAPTPPQIVVPDDPSLDLTELTIEGWVRFDTAPTPSAARVIVTKGITATSENYGLYLADVGGKIVPQLEYYSGGGFRKITATGVDLDLGQFHHLAVTADGSTVNLYVDGTLVHTEAQAFPLIPNSGPLQIGSNDPAYGNRFDGVIDELAIYSSALPAVDIARIAGADGFTKQGATIQGNIIGLDATGSVDLGHAFDGIRLSHSPGVLIGGTTPSARNVIAGNSGDGVEAQGPESRGIQIAGNHIGVDPTGLIDLGNDATGIYLFIGTQNNRIGGSIAAAGNLISGNGTEGVRLDGSRGNRISGNLIGTDITGTAAIGNGFRGVLVNNGSTDNLIGTDGDGVGDAAERNIVSGNISTGVQLSGSGTINNRVAGNYIGTDITGIVDLGNGGPGVSISGTASDNVIGTNSDGNNDLSERNVISGNDSFTALQVSGVGTDRNVIAGNYIGVDVTGTVALGNLGHALSISQADDTRIGTDGDGVADTAERNVISGNQRPLLVSEPETERTVIAGNYIGTNAAGTAAIPNGSGIELRRGAKDTRIGTDGSDDAFNANERNVISGNNGFGIRARTPNFDGTLPADGSTNDGTIIAGNYIGVDVTGTVALGNSNGVQVVDQATNVRIGTDGDDIADADERNIISGNRVNGIQVSGWTLMNLTTADLMIAGDIPRTTAVTNYAEADFYNSGNRGSWRFDNPIPGGGGDRYLVQGTGTIEVKTAGTFTFAVGSDNGSRLRVNGTDVVVYDVGNLGFRENFGSITLPVGSYSFEVLGYENGGGSGFEVSVAVGGGKTGPVTEANGWRVLGAANPAPEIALDGNVTTTAYYPSGGDMNVTIAGNYIGTDVTGTVDLGNSQRGIRLLNRPQGVVIGTNGDGSGDSIEGNVISGNGNEGIRIEQSGASDIVIAGNLIGTDVTGTTSIENLSAIGITNGVSDVRVGTDGDGVSDALERNLLSGNLENGFFASGATRVKFSGNYVGTDITGTVALPNGRGTGFGVAFSNGSTFNTIGTDGDGIGDNAEGNLVSGNNGFVAVFLSNTGTAHNVVAGNLIGTDVTGTLPLGNRGAGVELKDEATLNLVGTNGDGISDELERNIISGNNGPGVFGWSQFRGAPTDNSIVGNYIGTDITGTADVGNTGSGVFLQGGTTGHLIHNNLISGNNADGIGLSNASDNTITSNLVGTDVTGAVALPNTNNGLFVSLGSGNNQIGGSPDLKNVIAGAGTGTGIAVDGGAADNWIAANYVGVGADGSTPFGFFKGITLNNTSSQIIGTNSDGIGDDQEGNIVAANISRGIETAGNSNNNVIAGNLVGTGPDGLTRIGSQSNGITLGGNSKFTIVGTDGDGQSDAAERNIIAGAGGNEVALLGAGVTDNRVAGNYIGLGIDGNTLVLNGDRGVTIEGGASNNFIGTNSDGVGDTVEGNVIAGMTQMGVRITASNDNYVFGNLIGTDNTGLVARPNSNGVRIENGATGNVIGTDGDGLGDAVEGNLISGNRNYGVSILAGGNTVAGNLIGTDQTGLASLPNQDGGIEAATGSSLIGSDGDGVSDVLERNVISGNTGPGVLLTSDANTVAGNFIGVDITGSAALGNADSGVDVSGDNNQIGGALPAQRNVISGNDGVSGGVGITIQASGTIVEGNFIGTDAVGGTAIANTSIGISVLAGSGNFIGTAAAGNVISGHTGHGIQIQDSTANRIQNNRIGTSASGGVAIGNATGVLLASGASGNFVGTDGDGVNDAREGNVISGNSGDGLGLEGTSATNNVVAGNLIGLAGDGTTPLGNLGNGVSMAQSGNRIGTDADGTSDALERNVISSNQSSGIAFTGGTAHVVAGNYIGTDITGTVDRGNGLNGILIGGTDAVTVGGSAAASLNVISGNQTGITVTGNATGTTIEGNRIGTDVTGALKVENDFYGIDVIGAATVTSITANLIGGGDVGVITRLLAAGGSVEIASNVIGTDLSETRDLGPATAGIQAEDRTLVGGISAALTNVIARSGSGVKVIGATQPVTVRGNRIFDNAGKGIDLDFAAPSPFLNTAVAGAETVITGDLFATDGTYDLDFYVDHPSLTPGRYLGSVSVVVSSGKGSFTTSGLDFTINGDAVTATATDAGGTTSEFSTSLVATTLLPPTINPDSLLTYIVDPGLEEASFGLPVTDVDEGFPLFLTGDFSNVTGPASVTINWGDGTVSTNADLEAVDAASFTALHVYEDDDPTITPRDQYAVTVTVTDSVGSGAATLLVNVDNVAPVITAASLDSAVITEGGQATISGSFTDPGLSDQHRLLVDWGDGSSLQTLAIPTGQRTFSATHTFNQDTVDAAGLITLTLTDDDGGVAVTSQPITVENEAPTASIILPPVAIEGVAASLSASVFDPGGDPVSYQWVVGGEVFESSTANFTPTDDGSYPVSLTVTDDRGAATTTKTTLVVGNAPPALDPASVSVRPADPTLPITEGVEIVLSGTFDDTGLGDAHQIEVDFGDGSPLKIIPIEFGGRAYEDIRHTYEDDPDGPSDIYNVSITLRDEADARTVIVPLSVPNFIPEVELRSEKTDDDNVTVGARVTDLGVKDDQTYEYLVDGIPFLSGVALAGERIPSITFPNPGGDVEIVFRSTDPDGDSGQTIVRYFVLGDAPDTINITSTGGDTLDVEIGGVNTPVSGVNQVLIAAGGGNDILVVDSSSTATPVSIQVDLGDGDDTVSSGGGDDLIFTGAGDDSVFTGDGDDVIVSNMGDDTINAGTGNNEMLFELFSEKTLFDGGGIDTLNFSRVPQATVPIPGSTIDGVKLDLSVDNGDPQDVYSDNGKLRLNGTFENVVGSQFADLVTGNLVRNELFGGPGNDSIISGSSGDTIGGGEGADTIFGGPGGDDSIDGGQGNDTITSGDGNNDTIFGGVGDDSIISGGGNDTIGGGEGADTIFGGPGGDESIDGGLGDDVIQGDTVGDGNDSIFGGPGNDSIISGGSGDTVMGGDGEDTIFGGPGGNDSIDGGADDDTIIGGIGDADSIFGGPGDDSITTGGMGDTVDAGSGNDTIFGGPGGNESIDGGAGDDTINVGDGDADSIFGGPGDDSIVGGAGDNPDDAVGDTIDGGGGNDTIFGGPGGNESIDGGAGDDTINAGDGDADSIFGGPGDDSITGGAGDDPGDGVGDTIDGGSGNDTIFGGPGGNESIHGGAGDDTINVGDGDGDSIFGGPGDDSIQGGLGDTGGDGIGDTIDGGSGEDTIFGGPGGDESISGGIGNDTIVSGGGSGDTVFGGPGDDSIENSGGNDTIAGGEGADTIFGGPSGDESIDGGLGDDTIDAGSGGEDTIFGGPGNDSISGGGDDGDTLIGGEGADTIFGGAGANDSIDGGGGDDTIVAGDDDTATGPGDTVFGGPGDDSIVSTGGSDTIDGGSGDDTIFGGPGGDESIGGGEGNDTIVSGDGDRDSIFGGPGDDSILGGGGDAETIGGGSGDDTIFGGPGSGESIDGGGGDDSIATGGGSDTVFGGPGDDSISGSVGGDTIDGGSGDDSIFGGPGGNDSIQGSDGNDTINAGGGIDDTVFGGAGDDLVELVPGLVKVFGDTDVIANPLSVDRVVIEQDANLSVVAGAGPNQAQVLVNGVVVAELTDVDEVALIGGPGDNTLDTTTFQGDAVLAGMAGNDILRGGAGDDSLEGGSGDDQLSGGRGSDRYVFVGSEPLGADSIDEAPDVDDDTLDFFGWDAGIDLDLNTDTPQTVSAGLDLQFSSPGALEGVIGTTFSDKLVGNDRNNLLVGGGGIDSVFGGGGDDVISASRSKAVFLDFDSETEGSDHVYTPDERDRIEARIRDDYAAFDVLVSQTRPDEPGFITVRFNSKPQINGRTFSGGASERIGWRDVARGGRVQVDVNGFFGIGGNRLPPTSDNFVALSSTIASHELGHMYGLRHHDSFGSPGEGVFSALGGNAFLPNYDSSQVGAPETSNHLMASPASVRTTLTDALGNPYFSEREALKLAFSETGVSMMEAETAGKTDSLDIGGTVYPVQPLGHLPSLFVPNTIADPSAENFDKDLGGAAANVIGSINIDPVTRKSENDIYSFQASLGDVVTIETMSVALRTRLDFTVDTLLRVYDSTGKKLDYYGSPLGAFNDDGFEPTDSILIDLQIPADGTYYVEVDTFNFFISEFPTYVPDFDVADFCGARSGDIRCDDTDTGDYELLIYRFDQTANTEIGDVIVGGSGADTLIGSSGNDFFLTDATDTIEGPSTNQTVASNAAPVVNAVDPITITEGDRLEFTPVVTDSDFADELTYRLEDAGGGSVFPTGATIDPVSGLITWDAPDDGLFEAVLAVIDLGGAESTQLISITVENDAPVATLVSITGSLDEASPLAIVGQAIDAGGINDTLTYLYEALQGTSIVDSSSGVDLTSYSFTPPDDGTYEIRLTVSDEDGGINSVSNLITVNNVVPTTIDDTYAIDQDAAIAAAADQGVLSNDSDPADALVVTRINGSPLVAGADITLPSGAILNVQADGAFNYDTNVQFDLLPSGVTAQDSFTYEVSDGDGGDVTRTVTITVTGDNDQPVITAVDVEGSVIEDTATTLTDAGSVLASDADQDSLLSSTVALQGITTTGPPVPGDLAAALVGGLTIAQSGSTVDWEFAIDDSLIQYLREGETVSATYRITVDDSVGAANSTAGQDVLVVISGRNDQPDVAVIDLVGDVTEGVAAVLTDNGSLFFADLDQTDVINATVAISSTATTGPAVPSPLQAALNAAVTLTQVGTNDGTVQWNFAVDDSLVQYLAATETVTSEYVITISDNSGASNAAVTETLTVTVNGVNDRPVITAVDVAGSVTEDAAATLIDSGSLIVSDDDDSDVVTTTVVLSGTTANGPAIPAAAAAALNTAVTLTPGSGDNLDWDFAISDALIQYLGAGESIIATYTVTAVDDSGLPDNSSSQDLTIEVVGRNDRPTITVVDVDGGVTEDEAATLTESGSLAFADLDTNDTITTAVSLTATATSTSPIPADLQAALATAVTINQAGTPNGSVTWDFALDNNLVKYLTTAETVTATYTIDVRDDSASANDLATQDVTVVITGTNAAPELTSVNSSSGSLEDKGKINQPITVSGTFFDANEQDTHVVTIDWGDGSAPESVTVHQDTPTTLDGTYEGSHKYASGGIFTVTVTIDDGNGGTDVTSTRSYVKGVGVVDRTLYVIGTDGEDEIEIDQKKSGKIEIEAEFNDGGDDDDDDELTVDAADVDRIVMFLCGDEDEVELDTDLPTLIDGGRGEDEIEGGDGRDILIGGRGEDELEGGGGQDLLIDGTYEGTLDELFDLQAIWNGTDIYLDRVDTLIAPGGPLGAGKAANDGSEDELEGDDALDLFFLDLGRDEEDAGGQEVLITETSSSGKDEPDPSTASLSGFVWQDSNRDGLIGMNEHAIEGVTISLYNDANVLVTTTTTDRQGSYSFNNLPGGIYRIVQHQPAGFVDGEAITQNGGVVTSNQIANIQLNATEVLTNFNFSEYDVVAGASVRSGQTATIGFWYGKTGRRLIRKLNGTSGATELGDYLATHFPNMLGDFAGLDNREIKSEYVNLYKERYIKSEDAGRTKLELEVLSLAISSYVTNRSLVQFNANTGNLNDSDLVTAVEDRGFLVTDNGVAAATYDLGIWVGKPFTESDIRTTFGLAAGDSLVMSVLDILKATDAQSGNVTDGALYDGNGDGISDLEQILRCIADAVYTDINNRGSI